jgi:hypothetical protein
VTLRLILGLSIACLLLGFSLAGMLEDLSWWLRDRRRRRRAQRRRGTVDLRSRP